jgi:hypothetical protein
LIVRLTAAKSLPSAQPNAREAVAAEAGRGSVEEVVRSMSRLRVGLLVAMAINIVLFVAIISDMVLKPF